MSYLIQQSTTSKPLLFSMVSSSNNETPATGLTPTVTISKNGGSFATPTGTVSEIGSGWYAVAGNATDTNTLGVLALHATASGADAANAVFNIVAFNPDSSTNLGLSNLGTATSSLATASSLSTLQTTANGISSTLASNLSVATSTLATASNLGTLQSSINTMASSTTLSAVQSTVNTAITNATSTVVGASPGTTLTTLNTVLSGITGGSSHVSLNLAQTIPTSNTAQTVGDALNAARSQGFGAWTVNGTTLTLYAADGVTVVRTFTLNSSTNPTSRT